MIVQMGIVFALSGGPGVAPVSSGVYVSRWNCANDDPGIDGEQVYTNAEPIVFYRANGETYPLFSVEVYTAKSMRNIASIKFVQPYASDEPITLGIGEVQITISHAISVTTADDYASEDKTSPQLFAAPVSNIPAEAMPLAKPVRRKSNAAIKGNPSPKTIS